MSRSLAYMGLTAGTPMTDVRIDKVFIGSCTNSRIEDLRAAAEVVRGKNVYQAEVELVGPLPADAAEWLRPGMTGTIKLEDGTSPTLVTVLRSIVDELRMRLWW